LGTIGDFDVLQKFTHPGVYHSLNGFADAA
jgi:hypothetical protein